MTQDVKDTKVSALSFLQKEEEERRSKIGFFFYLGQMDRWYNGDLTSDETRDESGGEREREGGSETDRHFV